MSAPVGTSHHSSQDLAFALHVSLPTISDGVWLDYEEDGETVQDDLQARQ